MSLTGCGEIKKAETAVNGLFTSLKELDLEEAQKYADVSDLSALDDETEEMGVKFFEIIFKDLNYEIISSEKTDKNTVLVKTKITATDMVPVMGDFATQALQYAFSAAFQNPQPTEEETTAKMMEILFECASKPDLATVTNEIDIKVVKNENNEWKIETDDAFVNAISGNLEKAIEETNNSLNIGE